MRNQTIIFILIILTASCMERKVKLLNKIESLGFPENEILVTLEDFFEGNNDRTSIGVNILENQPSPQEFYIELKKIRNLDNVQDVLVRIQDIEDTDWPFTDTIYIISSLSFEEIKSNLKELQPDEIYEDWMYSIPINAPEIEYGNKVFSVWWD